VDVLFPLTALYALMASYFPGSIPAGGTTVVDEEASADDMAAMWDVL
jgi:hypothetical protein